MHKLLLVFFVISPVFIQAQSLTRGPYLQKVSDDTVIVRWRTDLPSDSRVTYGLSVGSMSENADNSSVTTEHRVEIGGLSPDTKYFYKIGSSSSELAGSSEVDDSYFFVTNPLPGSSKDTRIWVLGDSGRGNANAYAVKQGYLNYINGSKKADLFLMLGDNAYDNGLDNEYDTGLFNVYPEVLKNTVIWPTLGNHDGAAVGFAPYNSGQEIPYYSSFSLPRSAQVGGVASGTEAYYSFDYANIHFICLNSYSVSRSASGAMADWLKLDLAASDKIWKIAYWHHPPYSKGNHDSDTEVELVEMRENILPILEDGGIDLVLAGHSHTYERSYLLDNHYGKSDTFASNMILDLSSGENSYLKPPQSSPHMGAVYVVNGVGALASAGSGTMDYPAMFLSLEQLGSMIIDINGTELKSEFIDENGNVVDRFRISKQLKSAFASSQSVIRGRVSGEIEKVQQSDGNYQSLIGRKRKGIYRLNTVYGIDLPYYFSEKNLLLRAYKRRRAGQNFKIYYSADGTSYKFLDLITEYKADAAADKFLLGSEVNDKLYIKIKSGGGARKNRKARLRVDQLIVVND